MEVFDFMPYTYYTRMTVGGGKVSWITSVMGWPLDSCHSERSEESQGVARMTS